MARRKRSAPEAWRTSPAGIAAYQQARAAAQAAANSTGYDHGVEWNDLFHSASCFMLPMKHNRYGHETTCEVVSCESIERCQPGHGPMASRPPSPVGPDYHGGPWVGREQALVEIAAWEKRTGFKVSS